MNILFIAPYVPSRIRVRPFHIIRELAKQHNIYVVALSEPGGNRFQGVEELERAVQHFCIVPHSKLRGYCQSLMALPSPQPMCTSYCCSPAAEQTITRIMADVKFDMIHIEHLRAAHFSPLSCNTPVLFDSVDCLTGLFQQMAQSKKNPVSKLIMLEEALCLRRYEPKMLKKFDHIIITSEAERKEIIRLDNSLNISTVPNGVDTEYFAPQGSIKHPRRFIFNGKMSYSPNAQAAMWFAENVFPEIRSKLPDAEFSIVGSDPPAQVEKLSSVDGITVTGYVDDIRPYLDSASVAVAPMQVAVGIQNKVLEAISMGLPVITSRIASRAFKQDCPGIIEADTTDDVIREALKLAQRPELAAEIGCKGREEVTQNFSWKSSVDKLEHLYEELIIANKEERHNEH